MKDLTDEQIFAEFRELYNFGRNEPVKYENSPKIRERMRELVAEMKKRGFPMRPSYKAKRCCGL